MVQMYIYRERESEEECRHTQHGLLELSTLSEVERSVSIVVRLLNVRSILHQHHTHLLAASGREGRQEKGIMRARGSERGQEQEREEGRELEMEGESWAGGREREGLGVPVGSNVQGTQLLGPSTQAGVCPGFQQDAADGGTVSLGSQVQSREPCRLGEWRNDRMKELNNDRINLEG